MSLPLRPAVRADALAVANAQIMGWRETYGEWLSPFFFAKLSAVEQAARLGTRIDQPGIVTLVAESGGAVVGYSAAGPGRDDDAPLALELYALYLLAAHQRTGTGRALLVDAIGDGPAYLWVLARNTRAQEFYRRHGFELDGTARPLDYFEGLIEVRMQRP